MLNRFIPEYYKKRQFDLLRKTAIGGMIIQFLTAILFAIIVLTYKNGFIELLHIKEEILDYVFLICILIIFALESKLVGGILVSLLENRYWNISNLFYSALKFQLYFLSLYLGYGIIGIIWSWLAVEAVLLFLYLIKVGSLNADCYVEKRNVNCRELPIKRMIRYGFLFFYSSVGYFILDIAIDNFFISHFLDTTAVGLYSFAFGIPLKLLSFSPGLVMVSIIIPVSIIQYTEKKDEISLKYIYQLFNKIIFFSGIPIFTGLILLSDKIIMYVFNPNYMVILPLFIVCCIFCAIKMFIYSLDPIIQTLERVEIYAYCSIFALYNIIMDIILIPKHGLGGAAAATLSAQLFMFLFQLIMTKRHISINYPWQAFIKMAINVTIMGCIVYSLRCFVNSIVSLGFVIAIGALAYFISAYINKGFDEKDRSMFNQAVGRIVLVF